MGEIIQAVKQLREYPQLVTMEDCKASELLSEALGSNNWVVSGDHTVSGLPLQANDPHLQVDRLPAIFYEVVYKQEGREKSFLSGITVPGYPGAVMGRTQDVSFGFTYGFMDQWDYYLEKIENGRALRFGGESVAVVRRTETIMVKGSEPVKYHVFETEDGHVIELTTERDSLEDGYYVASKWTWDAVSSDRLPDSTHMMDYKTVDDIAYSVRKGLVPCNYLLADTKGNIAYQQSGILPKRNANYSLLLPTPAWWEDALWTEVGSEKDLLFLKNPKSGYFATANNDIRRDLNPTYALDTISFHMGPYRAQRASAMIQEKIDSGVKLSVDHMKEMQLDLYSVRAERLMPVLIPLLPSSLYSVELQNWDMNYFFDSRGALLFDVLVNEIMGTMAGNILGDYDMGIFTMRNATMKRALFTYLDDILVDSPNSSIFGPNGRDSMVREIAERLLGENSEHEWVTNQNNRYGEVFMPISYKNLFFSKQTSIFDKGPYIQEGHTSVLMVGDFRILGNNSYNSGAAWRYVTDLATFVSHTSLPGGPSGSFFSSYYSSDLSLYLKNKYKIISP